ncbi:MAG: hypothetical protein AB8B78_11905 [Polaribacter sp.]
MKLLVDDVNLKQKWKLIADKNKLLQMNSKSWVRNGLKLFKNIFTYSSILTVVLFIISLVILLETFFN